MLNPRVLALVTASIGLSACHLIKVNGKPLGGQSSSQSASGAPTSTASTETPREDESAAPAPVPAHKATPDRPVSVGKTFGPNPLVVAGVGGKTSKSTLDLHGDRRWTDCQADITEHPTMVLQVESDTEKLSISGPPGSTLFARREGKVRCANVSTISAIPVLSLKDWTGKVELWVGKEGTVRLSANPTVSIEDFSRPRSAPWLDEGRAVKLSAAPKKPKVISLDVPALAKTPAGLRRCGRANFRAEPDLLLRFERPITNLVISARTYLPTEIMIMGPIPDDHRDIPAICLSAGNHLGRDRLVPGLYAIKVGTSGQPTPVSLVLRHADAPTDPLVVAKTVPEGLALEQRQIAFHFPMLDTKDIEDDDTLRAELFMRAPAALFVFPRYDLDNEMAKATAVTSKSGALAALELSYPRANEPLLFLGKSRYLAADGSIFVLNASDVQTTAKGSVSLPSVARNAGLRYAESVGFVRSSGTRAEKAVVARSSQAWEKSERCKERIWKPKRRTLEAIERGPYSVARQRRIASIERATRDKVYAQCTRPYERHNDKAWRQLLELRTQRRTRTLAKVRKRMKSLF